MLGWFQTLSSHNATRILGEKTKRNFLLNLNSCQPHKCSYHHFSKPTTSESDFTILTSDNSGFDLETRENLNSNIPSTSLYLF